MIGIALGSVLGATLSTMQEQIRSSPSEGGKAPQLNTASTLLVPEMFISLGRHSPSAVI